MILLSMVWSVARMIYGGIIYENIRCYTDLLDIFHSLGDIEDAYNFLITDFEIIGDNEKANEIFPYNKNRVIIDGNKLSRLMEKKNFQWIWGSFCCL